MTAYVCVHGHAYQPPRESPDTGEVERQPSADPFHDWNERVTSECYAPLSQAKRLDEHGSTLSVTNLWEHLSFDLGPTLGVWMDRRVPGVATSIAVGDSTGGGAMAHPWVHAILPLTPAGDRATIVRWASTSSVPAMDGHRSACGCPRPRSIRRASRRWPTSASPGRCWLRTRSSPIMARAVSHHRHTPRWW